jgi:hypothetical protein
MKDRSIRIAVGTLVLVLLGAAAIVTPIKASIAAGERRERTACLMNLNRIDAVLNCAIPVSTGMNSGDPIDPQLVARLMEGGHTAKRPSGVDYIVLFVVGGHPRCPVHGPLPSD